MGELLLWLILVIHISNSSQRMYTI
ncbi:hypothetical protein EE612_021586 [Oryza sativa]|nr:hypothetical protein EE612_021586 [Oryza sativa]